MFVKQKIRNLKFSCALIVDRFRKEIEGVAAIEFALIAPVMLLLFIGTLEVSAAVSINRKVARISSTVGDLITQANSSLSANDIQDIMKVSEHIMLPYKSHTPKIEVQGIDVGATKGKEAWKCTTVSCVCGSNSDVAVPSRIRKDGSFLVQATVSLDYQPIIGWARYDKTKGFFTESTKVKMEETIYLRPRISPSLGISSGC